VSSVLPVADKAQVRVHTRELLSHHRRSVALTLGLHAVAVSFGLVGPRVLGRIVEGLQHGISRSTVDHLAMLFAAALVVQVVLTRWARLRSAILGEEVLAELREGFLARTVTLPLGTVERASTGDLVTRSTSDIDNLQWAVRHAAPEITVAGVSVVLIL
jgi:ABC-type multidrug transport system fused ATPase/permease subunit